MGSVLLYTWFHSASRRPVRKFMALDGLRVIAAGMTAGHAYVPIRRAGRTIMTTLAGIFPDFFGKTAQADAVEVVVAAVREDWENELIQVHGLEALLRAVSNPSFCSELDQNRVAATLFVCMRRALNSVYVLCCEVLVAFRGLHLILARRRLMK